MDSMGRLPARILPHAARTSRGLRLGFGTVVLMPDFDAVTRPQAATMLLDLRVGPLAPEAAASLPFSGFFSGPRVSVAESWAPNAAPPQLSLACHRDSDFDFRRNPDRARTPPVFSAAGPAPLCFCGERGRWHGFGHRSRSCS